MSTEKTESTTQLPAVPAEAQAQPANAEWGAPPPPATPRSKWTVKRTAIAVAVAVGIAAAGGAAIYAASGSVTNNQGGPGGGPGGMAVGPGNGRMMGGPFANMSDTQHGEFQTGEVTEISDTSITVKSEDDYTQTYTIDDNSQVANGIEKGDEVTVIATTENDTATVETVIEAGTMQGAPGGNGGTDGNGGPPNGGNSTPPTTN